MSIEKDMTHCPDGLWHRWKLSGDVWVCRQCKQRHREPVTHFEREAREARPGHESGGSSGSPTRPLAGTEVTPAVPARPLPEAVESALPPDGSRSGREGPADIIGGLGLLVAAIVLFGFGFFAILWGLGSIGSLLPEGGGLLTRAVRLAGGVAIASLALLSPFVVIWLIARVLSGGRE